MGLGPMVCLHCELFLLIDANHDYYCPKCGEENYVEYMWMFTEEEQKRITDNSKFYKFVSGKE